MESGQLYAGIVISTLPVAASASTEQTATLLAHRLTQANVASRRGHVIEGQRSRGSQGLVEPLEGLARDAGSRGLRAGGGGGSVGKAVEDAHHDQPGRLIAVRRLGRGEQGGDRQLSFSVWRQAGREGGKPRPDPACLPRTGCLVCEEKIRTWRGDIRVECRSGAEYHARTGQLVEEPICGLSADP
jgi:hypothetical protein